MNSTDNMQAVEQKPAKAKKEKKAMTKGQKIWLAIAIILTLLLLLILCVEIAYLADFIRFNNTDANGLLLTKAQRVNGIFGFFKNN
ncbi:hypothetical protein ACWXVL_00535 [Mycoplasma sp. 128]|uniref:hypothetical protein n=1 Tax=Mycoplasma sp. 3341 TaxID=3447506 RepID=UPI003F65D7EF